MKKRGIIWSSIGVVLIATLVTTGLSLWGRAHETATASSDTPTFATITPNAESSTKVGGWQRVSPSYAAPVYAYADTIAGVSVTVSEQQLPASFKTDPSGQLQKMATAYNATEQLATGNTKMYIGTSVNGPQSVILIKNNLLILIKSEKVIDNKSWLHYVAALS